MSEAILDVRRRALEDAFFIAHDRKLTRGMIDEDRERAEREAITAATGITDAALIDTLLSLGLRGPVLAALAVVPLVAIAWADGDVGDSERHAVMDVAGELGLDRNSETFDMLEAWLVDRPPPALLEAWEAHTAAFMVRLNPEGRRLLREEVMTRARAVAEAQGGFLMFGRISAAEQTILGRLETALS